MPIVTPEQHAADYAALRTVINNAYSGAAEGAAPVRTPRVVGPDTTWGAVGDEKPDGGRFPIPGTHGHAYRPAWARTGWHGQMGTHRLARARIGWHERGRHG